MNTLARLGALAGTAALTLGLAGPALADTFTYYDKAGDVWADTCTYPADDPMADGECTDARDSTIAEGDVIAASIQHNARKIVLRVRYRELTRDTDFHVFLGDIRTNEHLHRGVAVGYDSEEGVSFADLFRMSDGNDVRCSLGRTVDFTNNLIEVRIPRGCLSSPRWIQAGMGHLRFSETEGTAEDGTSTVTEATYFDDALSGYYSTTKMSPKLFRN
ncbi:hypothetical protein [Nocardioides jejuensis]|uniref:Uncharacterized protein n=1 Tax=Nocardioides jejuensis TaxID=2502782 RepID=A0A4V2NZV5_9ACTN|nr:hypothetical protein [Nocardioides jejuensis]TCJ30502.1 hypothetical protein EPD65_02710 [Nocardioides jejuensis]